MKKLFTRLLFVMGLLSPVEISAQTASETFSEGNLNYKIISDQSGSPAVEITGGTLSDGHLIIPATVAYGGLEYIVSSIGDDAFKNAPITQLNLKSAANLQRIGKAAFAECRQLETVVFPETTQSKLTEIGQLAFHHDISLKSFNLEDTHIEVLEALFTENDADEVFLSKLETIKLPETLRVIRSYALQFLLITDIEIPSGVTTFEDRVLEGCINLRTFTWKGAQITSLPRYTFLGVCDFLERVTLLTVEPLEPTGLTDNHFFWCDKELLQVILTPESIENLASAGYTNETSIYSTLVAYEGSNEPSAIDKIDKAATREIAPDSSAYYSLHGARVDKPKKGGIYIHKGRKVIAK